MSAPLSQRSPCACGCGKLARVGRNYAGGHRPKQPSLREKLLSQLVFDPESQCLLWTGRLDRDGYGRITVERRDRPVHRVVWEVLEGPIPDGLTIDHVKARGCAHKNCGSIAHLEPVTRGENTLRGDTVSAHHAAQTHCISGHAFTSENTRVDSLRKRNCRACEGTPEERDRKALSDRRRRGTAEYRERHARQNREYRARKRSAA